MFRLMFPLIRKGIVVPPITIPRKNCEKKGNISTYDDFRNPKLRGLGFSI